MKLLSLLFGGLLMVSSVCAQQNNARPQVIPTLQHWEGKTGYFQFSATTPIVVSQAYPQLLPYVEAFAQDLKKAHQLSITPKFGKKEKGTIFLELSSDTALSAEAYYINIDESVTITASNYKGIVWATRTLLQMLENGGKNLPKGFIKDYPVYSHRGFMLDVGRKFFTIDYLRDYVKLLSYYKINEFQIHLNDNGFKDYYGGDWSKTYAAFRLESDVFPGLAAKDGYYTKAEFRELQKLGMLYGVNVIPEIDVPAHSLAFTHYKPEIGSDKYGRDHLDLYNPETYRFVDALYAEYLTGENPVFIGPDVHIGTDEYDVKEAEKYREFTDRYLKYIQKLGKNVRMWGGLRWLKGKTPVHADDVVVNAWSHDWVDPVQSLKDGYKIISTPDAWLYIVPAAGYYRDYLDEKSLFESWVPEKVNPKQTLPEGTKGLLGAMYCVWNDHCGNGISEKDVHVRTLPATKVLSEKMWKRNTITSFTEFKKLADKMSEAPGVNLAAKIATKTQTVLQYDLAHKREKDKSGNAYNEVKRNKVSLKAKESALGFTANSYIATPLLEIGYDYKVSFSLNVSAKTKDEAVVFESKNSKVLLKKVENGYKLGFSRDGYTFYFDRLFAYGQWQKMAIVGTPKMTNLWVDNVEVERLEPQTVEGERKKKMYIQRTLFFPLHYIGSANGKTFEGSMKELKVEKL